MKKLNSDTSPWTFKPQGEANHYFILKDKNWLTSIQFNGELATDTQTEIMNLFIQAPLLLQACKDFVAKVESGKARSTKSYKQMKEAIGEL